MLSKRMLNVGSALLAVLYLVAATAAAAEIPLRMSYQVMLTDDTDQPLIDQTVELIFSIHDEEKDLVWTETHTATTNSIGVVSLTLGETTPLPPDEFGVSLWLAVSVDGEPLLPRRELVSGPYALHAYDADRLGGSLADSYTLKGYLAFPGTINDPTNPVNWTKLKGVPSGIADGVDSEGSGTGDGHSLDASDGDPADALYVDETGRVGVGTTDPQQELHLLGALRLQGPGAAEHWDIMHNANASNDYGLTVCSSVLPDNYWKWQNWGSVWTDFNIALREGGALSLNGDNEIGSIYFYTDNPVWTTLGKIWTPGGDPPSPTLYLRAGGGSVPHVVIRETGRVGIGTTSPATRLDVKGNITVRRESDGVVMIELGEGLDYAEGFDVTGHPGVEPGAVLAIDPGNPGKLALSTKAYDTRVAGIVAGGKGLGSGIRLGSGEFPYDVALAGRVYCNVDATENAVEPGDLLTTSPIPGYAMKATDRPRASGAILGKAMEQLEKGTKGQILVLVSLQ